MTILWYLPPTLWLELEVNIFCPSFEKITKARSTLLTLFWPTSSPVQVQRNSCHWSLILVTIKSLWFPTEKNFPFNFREKKDGIGAANFWHSFNLFWWQSNHIDFRPKKVSLQFSPKYRDVLCAANLCYSFTYFGDSAITLIFAKGWGSLAFSKMMVKKVVKIG